ncbi:DUF2560 family protein [Enterobacter hormaechei]|uniref:DUF2560 family protein n=1 Tax=Enterobacter hormaechei TaxID=158836 RepID=UPI00287508E7|nr:DUF2560 family protein [Enterobacter hormaechei]MDS0935040.1 DUF2560 family protein [Enterobacter hormaechei]
MADITQMTDAQKLKLEVYRLVMNDSAATEKAIDFIAGNELNFELFKDAYDKTANEPTALAKTEKAIREAKEVLDLFTTGV